MLPLIPVSSACPFALTGCRAAGGRAPEEDRCAGVGRAAEVAGLLGRAELVFVLLVLLALLALPEGLRGGCCDICPALRLGWREPDG